MPELKERFSLADDLDAPDLWAEARRRAATPEAPPRAALEWPPGTGRRVAVGALAFAVFAVAVVFAWNLASPDRRPAPRPPAAAVNLAAELGPGWTELPPPPEVRDRAVTAWTGSQLLVWGGSVFDGGGDETPADDGFVFDGASGSWSTLKPGPLAERSDAAGAWTGHELLIWGGYTGECCAPSDPSFLADGAAFDPATGSWRTLPPAPIDARAPFSVWTGDELIVWGSRDRSDRERDGAAYDPATDSWRSIAEAPIDITDGSAVWTGDEMIVFGAALDGNNLADTATDIGAAYDPAADSWRRIPDSTLSPQAATASWVGDEMIAWDYDHATAAYDPATDTWRPLARVPLRFYECYPRSVAIEGYVFGDFCGSSTAYSATEDRWHDVSVPRRAGWVVEPVAAGSAFLVMTYPLELSDEPGREFDTKMLAFVPHGAFVCAGASDVDRRDRSGARFVAERFLQLRTHKAEIDLERLLTPAGERRFASGEGGLSLLGSDYYLSEVVFVDGPLAPDDSYEVGVRLTTSPRDRVVEETLFLVSGENLAGEPCPLLVGGARPGLSGP